MPANLHIKLYRLYASATSVTETKQAEMDRMSRYDQGEISVGPKRRREANNKIYLRNIRREIVGWLQLAQGRFPMTALCEHGDKPDSNGGAEKF